MEQERPECPFNSGVLCDERKCRACGWNPMVDKKRKEEIKERKREIWLFR